MAHRNFTDSLGRTWDVWTVFPSRIERRKPAHASETSFKAERRHRTEFRVLLGEQWSEGWLAFETPGEKRRLAPFPDDWSSMSARQLEELCNHAEVVKPSRRLVE